MSDLIFKEHNKVKESMYGLSKTLQPVKSNTY